MARQIPEIVRAAAGLAATVLDEARKLPGTLPSLPIRIIGLAMQQAMRIQQQYAGLVARGDEVFTGLRGDAEPGLATFDDDDDYDDDRAPAPPAANGFRSSAFDRVDQGEQSIEELAEEAPATAEILDEIAIDELVDRAPTLEETAPSVAATLGAGPAGDAATVDVLTPDGDIATVEAAVTDEGIAAPEAPTAPTAEDATAVDAADDTAEDATAVDEGGTPVAAATGDAAGSSEPTGAPAPSSAPVDGYDSFSVAQLRGRLRGYALSTVQDLVAYEAATRAREPYLRMLRNRLEKLEEQAVESSPLAPRGA